MMPLYTYNPKANDALKEFMQAYDYQSATTYPEESIEEYLCPQEERICRFCHKGYPAVTFLQAAHLIAQLLGNEFMLSEYECDRCNKVFGKRENDLANYLGIMRTMQMVKGKKGIPSFSSPDNKTAAKKEPFLHARETVKVSFTEGYKVDRETGLNSITYKRQAYSPMKVFKSLYKIAMSTLDENECKYYSKGMMFLLNDRQDTAYRTSTIFSVIKHSLPDTNYPYPTAIIFKKRNPQALLPTHTMIFFYRGVMFQLLLPFNEQDETLFKDGGQISTLVMPPFAFGPITKEHPLTQYVVDNLTSTISKPYDETIYFSYDPEIMKNAVSVDLTTLTKSAKEFDDNNIAGLYIINSAENFRIKLNEINESEQGCS